MATTKTNTLATITEYRALATDTKEVLAVVRENLGNDRITERDLDRVTMPLGGGLSWTVPTLEGEESIKSLEGIIVHWTTPRAYWRLGVDEVGGSAPPDCFSSDGEYGTGDPGGDCFSCPMNQWGSAEKGHGKACKEKRMLFLLRPNSVLPVVVQAPSTSLQPLKKYLYRLSEHVTPYWLVVTRLGLEKAQSGGGITYSRIVPTVGRIVPEEQRGRLQAYVDTIKPLVSQRVIVDRDE